MNNIIDDIAFTQNTIHVMHLYNKDISHMNNFCFEGIEDHGLRESQ